MSHILIIDEDLDVVVLDDMGNRIWSHNSMSIEEAMSFADGVAARYGITRSEYLIEAV